MSCKYTLGNIRGPHGLSISRVGEGEFDGEFDGNSREFYAGFGEFDVFQYACGAMNPSIGAMRGRGKVSFYKTKREKAGPSSLGIVDLVSGSFSSPR